MRSRHTVALRDHPEHPRQTPPPNTPTKCPNPKLLYPQWSEIRLETCGQPANQANFLLNKLSIRVDRCSVQAVIRRVSILVLLTVTGTAIGAPPLVMFSNIASSPTSDVPGQTNWSFTAGNAIDDAFRSVAVSPSGEHWAVRVRVNSGVNAADAVVAVHLDNTAGGTQVVRTGTTSYVSSRTWDTLAVRIGVNDSGQIAFTANLSGSTSDDEIVPRWTPGASPAFMTMAREGVQAPGQEAGVLTGPVLRSVHVLSDGKVGVLMNTLINAPMRRVLYRMTSPGSGTSIANNVTTIPTGQLVSPSQTIAFFGNDHYSTSELIANVGTGTWYVARLAGPSTSDQVLVNEGEVIAQKGAVLPGSGFFSAVSDLTNIPFVSQPSGGGDALFFGTNANATDWASTLSGVVASTDGPIFPGSSERWDDSFQPLTFLAGAMNASGTWLIAGRTDAATPTDTVIVHKTEGVILREGDGVDLDGDGEADDNVYVAAVANEGLAIGANGKAYAIVMLRNSTGAFVGSAVVRIATPVESGCDSIDFNNDSSVFDPVDIDAFLSVYSEGPCIPETAACNDIDFNNDTSVFDPVDIDSFLSVYSEGPCI